MELKFFAAAISAYRSFSTRTGSKAAKCAPAGNKSRSTRKSRYEPQVRWSEEQEAILAHARNGYSMFITGSAGTGKTVLLQKIIGVLRKIHCPGNVFVTASTGVASCLLGGQTLHSFSGFGYSDVDRESLLGRVVMNKNAFDRWKTVEALVIDEISMIDASMFQNLEYVAREIRQSDEVWGGIKLVVCGDFFQLPPVNNQQRPSGQVFAFEADCWDASFHVQIELAQVFRQSDSGLIKLLQSIRKGETDDEDLLLLEQCCTPDEPDSLAVRLYPRIDDVKRVNKERLESLGERVWIYNAFDDGMDHWKNRLKQGMAPDRVALCRGARVMLIKNLNIKLQLCNGTTGTVTRFVEAKDVNVRDLCPDNLLPVVKFDSGLEVVIEPEVFVVMEGQKMVAWRRQMPLILAWALSIHKCQGMTLDRVHTDLSRAFGSGMVYVALSRVRSLEGLFLSGFSPSSIKAHPKVLDFYKRFREEDGWKSKVIHCKNLSHLKWNAEEHYWNNATSPLID